MTTIEPAEKLNNWSLLASTGNMVRYVIETSGQTDWDGRKIFKSGSQNALCQEAIERMNRNLAQACSISSISLTQMSLVWEALSVKIRFYPRRQKLSMTSSKPTKNTRSHQLSKLAPIMQMPQEETNLYGALVVVREKCVRFTGLSPKQSKAIKALKSHFSARCRSGSPQSDQTSISIKGESGHYQQLSQTSPTLLCLVLVGNAL